MTEATWNLLLQIPLAGIVVIVVFMFLRYLERSENRMRDFLHNERQAGNEAVVGLAGEIKTLNTQLSVMQTIFSAHDALMRERLPVRKSKDPL